MALSLVATVADFTVVMDTLLKPVSILQPVVDAIVAPSRQGAAAPDAEDVHTSILMGVTVMLLSNGPLSETY